MKKILILVDKLGPKKKLLVQEIKNRIPDSDITLATISDLLFIIDQENIDVRIDGLSVRNFDLTYIRRAGSGFSVMASNLAFCLNYFGVKYFDTTWGEPGAIGSKFSSLLRLASVHAPVLPSIYVWNGKIQENKEEIVEKLNFPIVAKETSTQRGTGVFKLNSMDDFNKLPEKDLRGGNNQYLFQKYVEIVEEYRLLVLGNKVGVWEKKIVTNPEEFRHNVALGAKEEFLDIKKIPEVLEKIAVKSAKALNLQVAGVDIGIDKETKDFVLIEVNRGPGFTYDTRISPELSAFADFLKEEINKND